MGIEVTRVLAYKSIYWINTNVNIEEAIKRCHICLDHQTKCLTAKVMSHERPKSVCECVGTDSFAINDEHFMIS